MLLDFERLRDGDAVQPEEGEILYALVRAIKPIYCVETGTHKSFSSHYIAQALLDNFETDKEIKGHLHTCDVKDWGVMEQEKNIALSPLKDWMTFHLTPGKELKVTDKINLLFLDGKHEKLDVEEEIDHFWPHLDDNAVVVFHDCLDGNEPSADVNGAIKSRKLNTTIIPSFNRMRVYFHGKDSTKICKTKKKTTKLK